MDSISREASERLTGTRVPDKPAVLLFIGAIVISFVLVIAGVGYAIYHSQHELSTNNQQWCTALRILTKTPVAYPADAKANPSRVFAYDLYESFESIEGKFGC
jgi:hypothetical protein